MNKKDDYRNIFLKLKKKGNSRILVESGLTFLNFLLKIKLINNLYVFKSNINLKKEGFNYSNNSFLKKINLKKKIKVNLLGDNLYKVKLK
jgi:riboflavin biosynthesis pyrimidine reductase